MARGAVKTLENGNYHVWTFDRQKHLGVAHTREPETPVKVTAFVRDEEVRTQNLRLWSEVLLNGGRE